MSRVRYTKEVLDALMARSKEAMPGECRGVISGVRTRRGVEVVAMHELGLAAASAAPLGSSRSPEDALVLDLEALGRLGEELEAAGTPVVCFYRSRMDSGVVLDENEARRFLGEEQQLQSGVEYLILSVKENETIFARAFSFEGGVLAGREVRIESE